SVENSAVKSDGRRGAGGASRGSRKATEARPGGTRRRAYLRRPKYLGVYNRSIEKITMAMRAKRVGPCSELLPCENVVKAALSKARHHDRSHVYIFIHCKASVNR